MSFFGRGANKILTATPMLASGVALGYTASRLALMGPMGATASIATVAAIDCVNPKVGKMVKSTSPLFPLMCMAPVTTGAVIAGMMVANGVQNCAKASEGHESGVKIVSNAAGDTLAQIGEGWERLQQPALEAMAAPFQRRAKAAECKEDPDYLEVQHTSSVASELAHNIARNFANRVNSCFQKNSITEDNQNILETETGEGYINLRANYRKPLDTFRQSVPYSESGRWAIGR